MDMDMGGMDMGGESMSPGDMETTNQRYAKGYWYFIAAALGFFLIIRTVNFAQGWSKLRQSKTFSVKYPTKPTTFFSKTWATLTAVAREMAYPQFYIPIRGLSWLTPPPMGRIYILLVYWAVIIYLMVHKAIIKDYSFYERIGYRNAWVTVSQVPLLYLLASRVNVIAFIVGTSYERLNWLHRWVARTMLVTATVHGWHFWTGWVKSELVEVELEMMPMVKYGLGAWGILLWMTITSFKPFRSMAYEVFVIQHILAAVIFLYLIYIHVPKVARYNVWFAIAALSFDRAFRLGLVFWQNIKFRPNRLCCEGSQWIGHQTQLTPIGDSTTILTIKDIHFKWKPGQHLYLWMPGVAPFEAHPYTIATAHQIPDTCICNSIQLVVRSHSGFSKRINRLAQKLGRSGNLGTRTAFIVGPYGHPPRWDIFETLVLISASTGASYTLPILESVLQSKGTSCIKRIDFLLTAKQGEEVGFYHDRLHEAMDKAKSVGIELAVHIALTGDGELIGALSLKSPSISVASQDAGSHDAASQDAAGQDAADREKQTLDEEFKHAEGVVQPLMGQSSRRPSGASTDSHIHHSATRPDVINFIRSAVEATGGETGVVVCGGQSLVANVRMSVAKLSDERAVHKGTDAQGIFLHVEEYCF